MNPEQTNQESPQPDPFTPPGARPKDDQLPFRRARKVLIEDIGVLEKFGLSGPFDGQKLLYHHEGLPHGSKRYLDVETALKLVVSALTEQQSQMGLLLNVVKGIAHGALTDGCELTTRRGSRELALSGGQLLLMPTKLGATELRRVSILGASPLGFYIVSGTHLIDPDGASRTYTQVPSICAGEEPGTVTGQLAGSFRADVLAVAPKMSPDDKQEFYLFLGPPSTVLKEEHLHLLPMPVMPGGQFPCCALYRVVTKEGQKGVHEVTLLANRIRQGL